MLRKHTAYYGPPQLIDGKLEGGTRSIFLIVSNAIILRLEEVHHGRRSYSWGELSELATDLEEVVLKNIDDHEDMAVDVVWRCGL